MKRDDPKPTSPVEVPSASRAPSGEKATALTSFPCASCVVAPAMGLDTSAIMSVPPAADNAGCENTTPMLPAATARVLASVECQATRRKSKGAAKKRHRSSIPGCSSRGYMVIGKKSSSRVFFEGLHGHWQEFVKFSVCAEETVIWAHKAQCVARPVQSRLESTAT